jgi:hypothetical protein
VRDEQNRHAQPLLEVVEQFENLRLDGHIERGGRLVGHEQFRFAGQRHGNHHALLHAAGHLKRIILDARFRRGNADQFQQADDLGVEGVFGRARHSGAPLLAFGRAAGRGLPAVKSGRCSLSDSLIWLPMRKTGFSDAPGS